MAANTYPQNRTEMFDALLAGWVSYDIIVTRLGDGQWVYPADDRGWTAKDHVANVTAWENIVTEVLRSGTRPEETLQLLPGSFETDPVTAADAAIHRLLNGQSVRRAARNRAVTHSRLIATLTDTDEPTLHRPFSDLAGIGGDQSVIAFVGTFLPSLYLARQQAIVAIAEPDSSPT